MIRKQIYLAPEQDRKVKALAAASGRSEAAIIRGALDRLAAPSESLIERLAAAGLLAEESEALTDFDRAKLQELEDSLRSSLSPRTTPLFLTEAVLAERMDE